MNDRNDVEVETLIAHIYKHLSLLRESNEEIQAAEENDLALLGRTSRSAVLIAGLLENYYTCAETIFVRISQFFENNLTPERWHKDLLDRMILSVVPIRPQVVSDEVYQDLLELMRFRHFRRYYFGTAYDWERLEELLRRAKRVHPPLAADLEQFVGFLHELSQDESQNE